MKTWQKIVLGIAIFFLILILSLPAIVRSVAESKGSEILKRELTIGSIGLGLFSGEFEIENLKISNKEKSGVFVAFSNLFVKIDLGELIYGNDIKISSIRLDEAEINVWQNDTIFNFSDLLESEETEEVEKDEPSNSTLYIDKIEVSNTRLSYNDKLLNIRFLLSDFNTIISNFNTADNKLDIKLNSTLNERGKIDLNYKMDLNSMAYNGNVDLKNFPISAIEGYLKESMNFNQLVGGFSFKGNFEGNINSMDVKLANSLIDIEKLALVDSFGSTTLAFPKTNVQIDSFDLLKEYYKFGEINLVKPTLEFVMYDTVNNNFAHVFKLDEEVVEDTTISDSVETENIDSTATEMYYYVKNFILDSANVFYEDRSLTTPFYFDVRNVYTSIESISPNEDVIPIDITANLCDDGNLKSSIKYYPKNLHDFNLNFDIENLEMTSISPYLYEYVGHKTLDGDFEMHSTNTVVADKLKSKNKIIIHDFFINNKEKRDGIINAPVKVALGALRNLKNKIKLNVPMKGDFSDPEFKVKKLIVTTLLNIVTKAAATPYNGVAKVFSRKSDEEIIIKSNSVLSGVTNAEKQIIDQVLSQAKKDKSTSIKVTVYAPNKDAKGKILTEMNNKKQYFNDWQILEKDNLNKVDFVMCELTDSQNQINLTDKEIDLLIKNRVKSVEDYIKLFMSSKINVSVVYIDAEVGKSPLY